MSNFILSTNITSFIKSMNIEQLKVFLNQTYNKKIAGKGMSKPYLVNEALYIISNNPVPLKSFLANKLVEFQIKVNDFKVNLQDALIKTENKDNIIAIKASYLPYIEHANSLIIQYEKLMYDLRLVN